jgi:hypothetical protein
MRLNAGNSTENFFIRRGLRLSFRDPPIGGVCFDLDEKKR